jgi:5'-3' exonuclease
MPNVKVIHLDHLEADFIPYYIRRNNLLNNDSQTVDITYSGDHDMWQNITLNDSYVYVKHYTHKKIIKKGDAIKAFFKFDCNFPDEYYPLAMAVVGDSGDNVFGVKGIATKRLASIFNELVEMVGSIEQLYYNVEKGKPIFINPPKNPNKNIDMILDAEEKDRTISRNLKLVSFELLSRYFDNPPNTETIEKKKKLLETLNNKEIVELEPLLESLSKVGVQLEDDTLENLYFKHQ